ncbi:metallophosphoesterase [Liquorilactobacillus capillatus]|uniref:Phosphoesterase n=1 Tax=Liquorilactobacillus capillatus DSM 19910 TaxID=1423731 RepID=A0A0R1M4P5_9LACO|nr:metallophosphoesterase [Liquorilactobacillus capillatus]KRL03069.1 phosphodiesterase [Liquorilactobacillus capillatus DSM 19910]
MGEKATKILVVSDNHGDHQILDKLITKYTGKVDAMFHCGDSELTPDDQVFNYFKVVTGNCDYDPHFPEYLVQEVGGTRVLLVHGHLLNVNMGLERLSLFAQERQAQVALFGHTHRLGVEYVDNCLYLNPGSISYPRGEYSDLGGTYAIIKITTAQFEVSYFDRSLKAVTDLHFVFPRN